jgi:WD40 repeat protein
MSAQVRLLFLAFCFVVLFVTRAKAEPAPCQPDPPVGTLLDRYGDPLPAGAVARLGTVRWRHPFAFRVGFSRDGKTLTSVGGGEFRVWDAASGRMLRRVPVAPAGICAAALSPDGSMLAVSPEDTVGREEAMVSLWDLATGKPLRQIKSLGGPVVSLAFSPDGKRLASCGWRDTSVSLWDPATGESVAEFNQPTGEPGGGGDRQSKYRRSFNLAFSPDGKMLLAGIERGLVRLWRVGDGTVAWSAKAQERDANGPVAFSPDSRFVVWGNGNKKIVLADSATGKELRILDGFPHAPIQLAWSPDSRVLASSHDAGTAHLWDSESGQRIRSLSEESLGDSALAFSPDGKTLLGAFGPCLHRWNATGNIKFLDPDEPYYPVDLLSFSPDGKNLATQDSNLTVHLRHVPTGKSHKVGQYGGPPGVCLLLFSADGKSLMSQLSDSTLGLRDLASRQETTFGMDDGTIRAAWFSPDGTKIVAGTSRGETVEWDASSGKQLRVVESPVDFQSADVIQWSSDGQLRYLVQQTQVRTIESLTGRENPSYKVTNGLVEGVAVSAGNKMLAWWVPASKTLTDRPREAHTAPQPPGPGGIALVEVVTGKERARLQAVPSGIRHLTFSPDCRWLAFAASDTVHVVDLRTGNDLQELHGDQGEVRRLAFSPDSRFLAAAGLDTTVLVWDLARLQEEGSLRPSPPIPTEQLETLWLDLADADAGNAFRAITLLAGAPSSVGFLEKMLNQQVAARQSPQKEILRWIIDLDDEDYTVREKASAQLERLGDRPEALLRKALACPPSLEVRRRIEPLLEKQKKAIPVGNSLRALRAVEILELVATPEARALLNALSRETNWRLLAAEADAAHARLTKIPKKSP